MLASITFVHQIMEKRKRGLLKRLRNKYRLVVLNDETFEEKVSLKLSRLNVFLVISTAAILLVGSTILLVAFTPLREYIPGYASTELRRQAVDLNRRTDSLQQVLAYNEKYLLNVQNIISGNPVDPIDRDLTDSTKVEGDLNPKTSKADSTLRKYVEEEDKFNISNQKNATLTGFSFMAPVKGLVSSEFDPNKDHFGIDVTARKNTPIKTCISGTVIFADWTTETGYVLLVQHTREIISVYKHCSALLKKQGDYVQTGEAIAIIGNSGENTSGPHLHFELWHEGNPVNPENYISF
jgi:murein DD-endopeptidase MepM/ murein hydrolase activator NlpD